MTDRPLVNVFAGGSLDRAMHLRRDADAIQAAWRSAVGTVAVFRRGRCLMRQDAAGLAMVPVQWALALLTARPDLPWALLGMAQAAPVFAVDLDGQADPDALLPAGAGAFVELRAAAAILSPADAGLVSYGAALLAWRERARFCGRCGARCSVEQAGHVMVCTACGTQFFPRTDPTVIMLVTHGDRALLGHSARFPDSAMYSTLAGFVEPGESLEEAVAREVMEEAGVVVGRVTYHSGQPWPFPMNLMLGFEAEALGDVITVDADELLDARWFTRADLRDPAAAGISLPPRLSIARRMIDDWLARPGLCS